MEIAGIDGCPGGWLAALQAAESASIRFERIECIDALFDRDRAPAIVAVDMPIGLPERVGAAGRTPERLVRPLLGERQSSVFAVPSRAAVYAESYEAACRIALETSEPRRKVAKQTFHLFPKIRELDRLLRARPALAARIHECHPEVSFWAMNDRRPLAEPKKIKSRPHPPGLALRRRLLVAHGFDERAVDPAMARALGVGPDDLIDACAAAWTAARIARGAALAFPDPPERDGLGLPVAIFA